MRVYVELLVPLTLQTLYNVQVIALSLAKLPYGLSFLLQKGFQLSYLLFQSFHVPLSLEQLLLASFVLLYLLQKQMNHLDAFNLLQFIVNGGVLAYEFRVAGGERLSLIQTTGSIHLSFPVVLPYGMLLLIERVLLTVLVLPIPRRQRPTLLRSLPRSLLLILILLRPVMMPTAHN